MTSTFPWHQSVTAFCQWTIFRGSYDAFRRSVCSNLLEFCPTPVEVSISCALWYERGDTDTHGHGDSPLDPARDRRAGPGGRVLGRVRVDRRGAASVPDARRRARGGASRAGAC